MNAENPHFQTFPSSNSEITEEAANSSLPDHNEPHPSNTGGPNKRRNKGKYSAKRSSRRNKSKLQGLHLPKHMSLFKQMYPELRNRHLNFNPEK